MHFPCKGKGKAEQGRADAGTLPRAESGSIYARRRWQSSTATSLPLVNVFASPLIRLPVYTYQCKYAFNLRKALKDK